MATLMLCSDGSRDVHGGAGTGDATWLEGGIFGDADAVLWWLKGRSWSRGHW